MKYNHHEYAENIKTSQIVKRNNDSHATLFIIHNNSQQIRTRKVSTKIFVGNCGEEKNQFLFQKDACVNTEKFFQEF